MENTKEAAAFHQREGQPVHPMPFESSSPIHKQQVLLILELFYMNNASVKTVIKVFAMEWIFKPKNFIFDQNFGAD